MTIDEAIKQFKEDAEYNRADLDLEWAEENEQVAKWLEELKELRKFKDGFYDLGNFFSEIRQEVRNKAIDDFGDWLKHQIVGVDNSTKKIIVVRNDIWADAIDTFLNEKESDNE